MVNNFNQPSTARCIDLKNHYTETQISIKILLLLVFTIYCFTSALLVTTGVFRIRKGKRFPWRFSTLFPQFFLNFSTRSEAECGNFEEILWKLSGKSEWKSFPLEYPENGSWLQVYLLSSIFGVSPFLVEPPPPGLWEGQCHTHF